MNDLENKDKKEESYGKHKDLLQPLSEKYKPTKKGAYKDGTINKN